MNDNDRNTRTLIICFTVAVLALIPLRFVEIGQMIDNRGEYQVLGETVQEVILPNAEVEEMMLEAPYDEIESQQVSGQSTEQASCVTKQNAEIVLGELRAMVESGQLERSQIDEVLNQMVSVEDSVCK